MISADEARADVKKIYKPMLRALPKIISRLKDKEIWVPLSVLARLDLHGVLDSPRHALLKFQVYHFLKRANNYRKLYFEINDRARSAFDKEMKAEGSYQPQMKEYRALSINLPGALVKGDGKAWSYSYDAYLKDIRYPSPKKDYVPKTGEEMFRAMESMVKWELVELERYRKISIKFAKVLKEDARKAASNPTTPYRQWRKETAARSDPEGRYYFRYKYKTKDIRGEVMK